MRDLKVTRKVHPGQHGSIRETKRYGDKLLAARYYKNDAGLYVKTAEIIIAERSEKNHINQKHADI